MMTNVIYLGATNDLARHGQIFREPPANLIARLKAVYPLIGLLFVNVEKLPAAQAAIEKAGTAQNLAYQQSTEKKVIPAPIPQKIMTGLLPDDNID